MRRRDFITLIGGLPAAWPLAARAHTKRTPKVGVLWHAGSAEEEAIYIRALNQGFNEQGYTDGKTIALDHRFPAEQPEVFSRLAVELAAVPVDVLVAVTQAAAQAAARATTKIPIVFTVVPDPVGSKLVNSLARPGGNITGLSNIASEIAAKRVQLLKEAFPGIKRVTLLVNPNDEKATRSFIDEATTSGTALGLDVQTLEVRSLEDFKNGFDRMGVSGSEAVITAPNGLFFQNRVLAAQLAVAHHLPLMVVSRETLEGGALLSYGPDFQAISDAPQFMLTRFSKAKSPPTCLSKCQLNFSS